VPQRADSVPQCAVRWRKWAENDPDVMIGTRILIELLIYRKGKTTIFQRILLATDDSEGALKAAEVAADQAKRHGGTLTVLYVMPMPAQFTSYMGAPEMTVDRRPFWNMRKR